MCPVTKVFSFFLILLFSSRIKRRTKLFLKLEDFLWRRNASKLPSQYLFDGSLLPRNLNMPTSFFPFPHSLKCKMCVVVGNSFAIKKTSLGSAINKYDVVIRLNNAPVPGYEEDVGNKTTMRIFYPESAISNPRLHNDEDTLMVMVPFKPHDLRWLKEMLYDEKRDRRGFWKPPPLIWLVNRSNVRVLDPHFMHQTVKQMPFQPTTGFLAVFVALNYCDVVHIAGFGYPPKSDQQQPIHYFENNTMKAMKSSPHDINHEAQALKRLEEVGALMYLHPHL
uniref:ST3 beta-galactoside alpha-2,3-sialyltransferase 4 n=1 Tax=Oryzias melastigma TaxID=30732 RepID=A0A3B3BHP4_ORYME